MKKIVSLILALALLLALTACGSGTSAGTAETTAPASTVDDSKGTQIDADGSVITKYDKATVSTDKELPHFKILVLYNSFTDKLGSQYKSSMEYIAEPLNIEFTFLETGSNADEATAAIEAALVNGYDGCIGTVATEARAALFDKAGVPYVVCGGMPSSEEQARPWLPTALTSAALSWTTTAQAGQWQKHCMQTAAATSCGTACPGATPVSMMPVPPASSMPWPPTTI